MSPDKLPREDMKTPGELPASAANAADWLGLLRSGARAHSPPPLLRTWFSKQALFTGR